MTLEWPPRLPRWFHFRFVAQWKHGTGWSFRYGFTMPCPTCGGCGRVFEARR